MKGIQIGKEVKLSLFADNMILHIENHKDATRKLWELINEFSKDGRYKINTQMTPAFLYANRKRSERKIKETIPFTTATRQIKYLGINLPKKAMAPHSSTLAWKIPWAEEPGRLQSMGSLRVGYDWATSLSLFLFMHWRRKWQPTPVFLPGESQGRGSLVGCRLWGRTELNTTEVT